MELKLNNSSLSVSGDGVLIEPLWNWNIKESLILWSSGIWSDDIPYRGALHRIGMVSGHSGCGRPQGEAADKVPIFKDKNGKLLRIIASI